MPMKRISRAIVFLSCAASLIAASASAQTHDKRVYYTFSGQVEIPGAVLPAGQYMFHLADPDSSRQVLQVQSADGKKVYGMFFSMPISRPEAPDEAEVRFMEAPAGAPPAISTVWYPGERTGRELIYPKEQAIRIARATNQSVLTTQAQTTKTDEAKSGDLTRVSPSGQDTQIADNAQPATPAGRSMRGSNEAIDNAGTPVTEIAQNEPRATTPVGTSGRESLPQTASPTPLMLLLGVGFLGAAAAIRFWRTARV